MALVPVLSDENAALKFRLNTGSSPAFRTISISDVKPDLTAANAKKVGDAVIEIVGCEVDKIYLAKNLLLTEIASREE